MLIDALTALGLVATSFAATNVDNLALLVGWILGRQASPRQLFAAHMLGMLTLLGLAFVFGRGADLFPVEAVGYLGVIPIGLGLKGLFDLARRETFDEAAPLAQDRHPRVLSIAATQVANGADTVLVFGPLFADSARGIDLVLLGGFLGMAMIWLGLARLLARHAARVRFVERLAPFVAPIFLILVGVYILLDTRTDVVPG
ncbi:MAG: cadmium resistance transporter [Deltaproteobacteria bacterium]|nr:cadmium resistance transporter [Deltaproteobacteria bacterium]MBW2498724.1 cadmium resistance transporter [Deltaproteobacteria bacterium]